VADQDINRFHRYSNAFKGDLPGKIPALRELFQLIVNSEVVEESTARSAIGAYVEERFPDGKGMKRPDQEYQDGEFDHRHYDALEAGPTVSLDSLSQKRERLALHLSEASPHSIVFDSPFVTLKKKRALEEISRLLTFLTPVEKRIIEGRFGLGGEESRTLGQIGSDYSLSGSSMGYHQELAIRKMRSITTDFDFDSTDSIAAVEPSWIQTQWNREAREPYLIETYYRTRQAEAEQRKEIREKLRQINALTEWLRREDRYAFDEFRSEAQTGEIAHLAILGRFAEQKDSSRALPYIRVLTEIAASPNAPKNVQELIERLHTKSLETAASQSSPSAYLALKWLAEGNNAAAKRFWDRTPTQFLSLEKTAPSVRKTAGIYLLNSKGRGYRLPEDQSLLILPERQSFYPFSRPPLLLFRPLTDGHLPLIREKRKISKALLPEKNLEQGYRLPIGWEGWVLKKKYIPRDPFQKVEWE
jgi:hypothetical protein